MIVRVKGTRTQLGLDLYHAFNSSAIQTYGARWLTPNAGAAGQVRESERASARRMAYSSWSLTLPSLMTLCRMRPSRQ